MPYTILAVDKPDALEIRQRVRAEHVAYLEARRSMILLGGPRIDDAGNACGAMLLIDTEDERVASEFVANDPYTREGLFQQIQVVHWRRLFPSANADA